MIYQLQNMEMGNTWLAYFYLIIFLSQVICEYRYIKEKGYNINFMIIRIIKALVPPVWLDHDIKTGMVMVLYFYIAFGSITRNSNILLEGQKVLHHHIKYRVCIKIPLAILLRAE